MINQNLKVPLFKLADMEKILDGHEMASLQVDGSNRTLKLTQATHSEALNNLKLWYLQD